jgi:hypothetical protein
LEIKGCWGNIDQEMRPVCSNEEGWCHILRGEGTRIWRDELVDKRFTSVDPETGIRRIVTNKNKDRLHRKLGYI